MKVEIRRVGSKMKSEFEVYSWKSLLEFIINPYEDDRTIYSINEKSHFVEELKKFIEDEEVEGMEDVVEELENAEEKFSLECFERNGNTVTFFLNSDNEELIVKNEDFLPCFKIETLKIDGMLVYSCFSGGARPKNKIGLRGVRIWH